MMMLFLCPAKTIIQVETGELNFLCTKAIDFVYIVTILFAYTFILMKFLSFQQLNVLNQKISKK